MNVLVIGCGYVGARVADFLHQAGHTVTGVTRSAQTAEALAKTMPCPVLPADVSDTASLRQLASRIAPPDIVLHCASSSRGGPDMYRRVFLEGCRNLAEIFPRAKIIFTSSTSVYPQTDGSLVTEESDASPERETSRILREAEDFVIAHHGIAARLAGIYGPSRSAVLKNFLEGKSSVDGGNDGRWLNQIHRDDAARALAHLASSSPEGVFNVTDDTPLTQRACFEHLARRFGRPVPPAAPPDTQRKRASTSKRVSNARLRATGWSPHYASYLDALDHDPALVPSILAQLGNPQNVVLVGLMGSGKSAVGRAAAQSLGFSFVDTDQLVIESAGRSIPDIFAQEGEAGFRVRETAALRSLAGRNRTVIATGGGIVTRPENLPLLKQLGFVVWLNASPETLQRRTSHSNDRPLLRDGDPLTKLRALLDARAPLYAQVCDLKITTDDLPLDDAAYGLAESARVHFSSQAPG
jgi:shikimate kinase/nucleoside-diphosphate-sugar epimerase